jgi:hypothetical protein
MSQPEIPKTNSPIPTKENTTIYPVAGAVPDPRKDRYYRCIVSADPSEGSWIFVSDTCHTPLRFHKDQEVILPEWAIEILRTTKIRQMVAKFAPFQKSVPYFPRITRRYIPEVLEEVSYAEYASFRDEESVKPLPGQGDGSGAMEVR